MVYVHITSAITGCKLTVIEELPVSSGILGAHLLLQNALGNKEEGEKKYAMHVHGDR